jgi:hypothetical protein
MYYLRAVDDESPKTPVGTTGTRRNPGGNRELIAETIGA